MILRFFGAALIAMTMTACGSSGNDSNGSNGSNGDNDTDIEKPVSEITLGALTSTDPMSNFSIDLTLTIGRFKASYAIKNTGKFKKSTSEPYLKDGQMVKQIRYSIDLDSRNIPGYRPFIVGVYYVLDGDESLVVDARNSNNYCDYYSVKPLPESVTRENTSGDNREFIKCSTPSEEIITNFDTSLYFDTASVTFKTRSYQPSTNTVLEDSESMITILTLDKNGNVTKVRVLYNSGGSMYFNAKSNDE